VQLLARTADSTIRLLDIDEQQRWCFPEGDDNNLIQPRLYRAGRSGHLSDLEELPQRGW